MTRSPLPNSKRPLRAASVSWLPTIDRTMDEVCFPVLSSDLVSYQRARKRVVTELNSTTSWLDLAACVLRNGDIVHGDLSHPYLFLEAGGRQQEEADDLLMYLSEHQQVV